MTGEAHPTALTNSESTERMLTLAAAMRSGELPPVARLASGGVSADFPSDWGVSQALNSPYAVGYAPSSVPDQTPTGEFVIEVDLSASTDPGDRGITILPAMLREAGSSVSVERLDDSGMRWEVRGDFPEDEIIMTGGHERTVSRVTVAFFPHNGKWLGAPAMVSVGARPADERAPNSNDLD